MPWALALMLLAAPAAQAATVTQLLGKGVQIYSCAPQGTGYAWHFKAPEAVLTGMDGSVMGHHFAGPTWQAKDGSEVTGRLLAADDAPQRSAVPWLVLAAKTHKGQGLFSGVSYIVRSMTEGGTARPTGCDAGHLGAEDRVAYQATYIFFSGGVP